MFARGIPVFYLRCGGVEKSLLPLRGAGFESLVFRLLLILFLFPCRADGFLTTFPKDRLRQLLQNFADAVYLKGFERLGDSRDFDHGHFIFSEGRAVAVLYHTQEFWRYRTRPSSLNPEARNWIQWIETGKIEDASLYLRRSYPDTPSWTWFKERELPRLKQHHTITVRMLDPELLGAGIENSLQWTFKRSRCPSRKTLRDANSGYLDVFIAGRERVCLSLSSSK